MDKLVFKTIFNLGHCLPYSLPPYSLHGRASSFSFPEARVLLGLKPGKCQQLDITGAGLPEEASVLAGGLVGFCGF